MDTETTTLETKSYESKSGIPLDAVVTHAEMMRAFEAFKETNDQRLALEQKRSGDGLIDDKIARIDAAIDAQARRLDEMTLKSARPALGGDKVTRSAVALEHKQAFDAYMRGGDAAGLAGLEAKALSIGSNADGGYTVPVEIETEIGKRLTAISPIRSIAGSRTISANVYKKPFMTAGPAVGWVGETDPRTQTTSPTLDQLSFPAMELYAMPAATATLLEDSAVNIDEWLAQEVEAVFAAQGGTAFVTGDGSNKPKGFLDYTTAAEASWEWGKIGYVVTGASGALPSSHPSDVLVDLIYTLKAGYRANARCVLNRRTQASIRKLKDADGHYLWQPAAVAGGEASLLGFPVTEAEDMPDIGANSLALAFGDFRRGYLVVDRLGVRVLRDPYSAKPYVLFYTTKRVGGGVQDFDAIKLLKFGTS